MFFNLVHANQRLLRLVSKITFVQEVGMRVCVCVCVFVSPPLG